MTAKKMETVPVPVEELRQRVVQSNPLLRAQYRLGEIEGKILRLMLSKIDPFKDTSLEKRYRIDVREVEALLGYGKPGYAYNLLISALDTLGDTWVTVLKEDEDIRCKWISSIGEKVETKLGERVKTKEYVTFTFHTDLESELIQLTGNYTSYVIKSIKGLAGQYTTRMFELLLQWVNAAQAGFPLYLTPDDVPEEYASLRNVMTFQWIFQHPYSQFGQMKRAILDRSKTEIEKKTNLRFEYRVLKSSGKGKKVCGVHFYNIRLEDEAPPSVVSLIREPSCQTDSKVLRAIQKHIDRHGEQYVTDRIHNANAKAKTNWKAFFLKSLDSPDWDVTTNVPRQEHLPAVKESIDALQPGVTIRFNGRDYIYDGRGILVGEVLLSSDALRQKIEKNEATIIDVTPEGEH